jgi:hypothetical protein
VSNLNKKIYGQIEAWPNQPIEGEQPYLAMMKSHVAWTGKYSAAEQTPEGIKLSARVEAASSRAIFGTDRVYFMRVDGNKLMVKTPGAHRSDDWCNKCRRV